MHITNSFFIYLITCGISRSPPEIPFVSRAAAVVKKKKEREKEIKQSNELTFAKYGLTD